MKIAIVGSGAAGIHAATELSRQGHTVDVFEASSHIGGHAQTLRIPFEAKGQAQEINIDLGDFMYDPANIHPYLFSLIKDKNIPLNHVPLNFTVSNEAHRLYWRTFSAPTTFLWHFRTFFHAYKMGIKEGRLKSYRNCAHDLWRFYKKLPVYASSPEYRYMRLAELIEKEHYQPMMFETWIYPQMQCWWGAGLDNVLCHSVQVLADSLNRVNDKPQFFFVDGFESVLHVLSDEVKSSIHINEPVISVERNPKEVIVQLKHEKIVCDAVILATPPSVAAKLLTNADQQERNILNAFTTTTTHVTCHQDTRWLPQKEKWSLVNFIQNEHGNFTTFWVGLLHPLKPHYFLTWGDIHKSAPAFENVIHHSAWLRTLPTVEYARASETLLNLQGHNRTWYCGAHVSALDKSQAPSVWLDNALKSGKQAADAIARWSLQKDSA